MDREELAQIIHNVISETIDLASEVVSNPDKYTSQDLTERSIDHVHEAVRQIKKLERETYDD